MRKYKWRRETCQALRHSGAYGRVEEDPAQLTGKEKPVTQEQNQEYIRS